MREEGAEAGGQRSRQRRVAAALFAARHLCGDAPMDGDARPWRGAFPAYGPGRAWRSRPTCVEIKILRRRSC